MATVLDIIQGISQAAANAYDGSHDERYSADGEKRSMGLRREEGDPVLDSREIDGFKIRFEGDKLRILYHTEMKLKDVHSRGGFEDNISATVNDVANYLKKEYKKVTGNTLTLTKEGDVDIDVQYLSNVRSSCQANCVYKIGGLDGVESLHAGSDKDRLDDAVKKWLSLGNGPKPKNVTRKKEQ